MAAPRRSSLEGKVMELASFTTSTTRSFNPKETAETSNKPIRIYPYIYHCTLIHLNMKSHCYTQQFYVNILANIVANDL